MIVPRAASPFADVPMLSLMTSLPGAITALTARAYSFRQRSRCRTLFATDSPWPRVAGAGSYTYWS